MILVISPLVQVARKAEVAARAPLYATSCLLTGVPFAAAVALLGVVTRPITSVTVGVTALVALLYGFHELGVLSLPVPSSSFRVPRTWLRSGRLLSAVRYGAAMGPGFFTATPFASYHVWLIALVMSGDVVIGLASGACFALVRAGSTLLGAVGAAESAHGDQLLAARARVVLRSAPVLHVVNGLVLAFAAGALATQIVWP